MRLKLNRTLRAALIAAITTVGTTLPQAFAATQYTAPSFGGAEYVWTNGHWEYPAGTTVDKIARVSGKGGVMVIENAGTVSNSAGMEDTSDYGGVKVTGNTNFTTGLGSWAGSIYVGAAAVLNASYGVSLKNTEAATAANVYVDGTLNITGGRTTLDLNDGRDYQNWYIGKEGFINLSSITGVTKGSRSWNIQLSVADVPDINPDDYKNRIILKTVTRQFMSTGADLSSSVNSFAVFKNGVELTQGTDYTIGYANGGFNVTYSGDSLQKMTLTWAGDSGDWVEKGSHWLSEGTETSFANGDDVIFEGSGNVATVSGAVSVDTLTVTGTATIDTSADGASVAANTLNIAAGGSVTTAGAGNSINFGTLTGSGEFVKGDKGTLTLGNSASGFNGRLTIKDGTLKLGSKTGFGSTSNTITIGANGTIDLNGQPDGNYTYIMDGGTLTNTGRTLSDGESQTVCLNLTANSTVKAESGHDFRLLGPGYNPTALNLNSKTLVKTGGGLFGLKNTAVSAGIIEVQGGVVNFDGGTTAASITFNGGTVTGTMDVTGDITLTALQAASTNATIKAGTHNVTFAGNADLNINAALTSTGALVKNGNGTTTIGQNISVSRTMVVNGGALNFNGTVTVTDLTSFESDGAYEDYVQGDTGNGFAGNMAYTIIKTNNGGTTNLAQVSYNSQTVDLVEGKYVDSGDTDYGTYYVNTDNATVDLAAATEYAASHSGNLTSVVVKGADDTLALGTDATLANLTLVDVDTVHLAGTGSIDTLVGTATLDMQAGAKVTLAEEQTLTVGSGKTLATTGAGTLEVTTLENNGGTMNLGSGIRVTGGGQGTGGDARKQGLYLHNVNGSVNLTGTADITGAMYASEGTVVIGDGINAARVEVNRVEFGDTQSGSNASILTIKANATLHVKAGDAAKSYSSTGILLGEWEGSSTANIYGNLYAENATAYVGDKQVTYNIENGGVMAVKGIGVNEEKSGKSETINLNLKDGGKLVLGANGISSNKTFNASFGRAEVGMTADTTLAKAITLTSAEGTTFNTTKYKWQGEGDQLTLTPDTTGGTMTVSGNLGGTGKLIAKGAGTLELSGANTHAGTVVNGGTLKAASAGALGSGDVTVNAGALELTTTTAVAGTLTINDGTLKLAGQNMLTADTLALGSGTVTFDLSNISVSRAGTITLATATTSAGLGSATVQVVWEGLAPIFSHEGVQVSGNSWIITLTADSQDLYWNGGTANWDATAQSWHTEAAPEEPVAFNSGDIAIFAADPTQAVANISGAMVTGGVIVREGADVVLQKATEAQEASISAPEIEISGALVSSVDMTATDIVGRGTDAAWEIAAGSTVTTATLSADEGATLTISGEGSLSAGTVTGDGTIVFTGDIQPEYSKIVVAEGKELELKGSVTRTISKDNLAIDGKLVIGEDYSLDIDGQYNPGTAGTDLHIRNNGNLAVSLGNDQNVLRMDGQSAGNLEIKSGHISYLSELGNQTLVMDNGTQLWFGNNAGAQDNPDFTNDIALNGDVTLRVYGNSAHGSVTISGDVDGAGHTLTKTDGNQVLTFTGTVTLGGLNVEGSGEKLVFKGSGSNLGAIKATSGAFTIQFSKADGGETASYTFDTFAMSPDNHAATRWLIVDAGVTVNGTGDTLSSEHATIMNSWGISGGGLEVNGTLNTKGVIGMDSGSNTSYIKGTGTINTKGLDLCNGNTTYIQGGITVNITSGTGIYRRNTGNASAIHLLDATLQAKDADWEFKTGGSNYTVTLDSATGTTFDAAANHTITLSKEMGGSGKLVKAGEGTVLVKGANTYSGGTAINKGTLETKNASALGTGNVSVGGNGTLLVSENLTIKGDNTAANNGLDNQGIVTIADGKTLTLWGLAVAKHYNLGTVNAAGDSAIIENTNHCATISLDAITGNASSVALYSNHSSDPANWNLGTADSGTNSAGELVLRVGDSTTTGGNRTVNYNFNNAEMFSGTTVTIENAAIGTPGKTMTNNVVLNADEVHVGGINDAAADTVVDKRNWSVAKGGEVDGRATLVLDADNTEAAYSTAIKVGADVDIRKIGEGVQTFSGDMSSFEGTVAVEKGTINVLNVDELSVQDVVIGAGATLGVYNDATATATSATEGTVAIDEGYSLTAAAGATLNANLVLNAGSALDVSATLGEGLQMGSDVALYAGDLLAVTPWPGDESTTDVAVVDAYLRAFFAQGDHEYYTLFTDVDMFSIDEVVQTRDLTFRDWLHFDLDAANVFDNLIENTYALVYHMGANAGKGTVALKMIPEPTTGTLSLLALAALAARRRRK